LRGDDTPLALAYADPILREQGLTGDRLGDIMSFFELSHRDAHYLLCDCHFHGTMTSRSVAARVRQPIQGRPPGIMRRVWREYPSTGGGISRLPP